MLNEDDKNNINLVINYLINYIIISLSINFQ